MKSTIQRVRSGGFSTHFTAPNSRTIRRASKTLNDIFAAAATIMNVFTLKDKRYTGSRSRLTRGDKSKLISYIKRNYSNPLFTLDLIQEELGLSYCSVNTVIRKEFNIGYKQYLNSIRIEKAKQLLSQTDNSIASIGEAVGYRYSNSFSRTFRSNVGITPNEYRKLSR